MTNSPANAHTHPHTQAHTCTYTHPPAHTETHLHTQIKTHLLTDTHLHTDTYTHSQTNALTNTHPSKHTCIHRFIKAEKNSSGFVVFSLIVSERSFCFYFYIFRSYCLERHSLNISLQKYYRVKMDEDNSNLKICSMEKKE